MKKIIIGLIAVVFITQVKAQVKLDEFGRIVLNTYLPDNIAIPSEAKNLLLTKLNQITSNNGMGGSQANPRFIITANVNVGTKDIIAGPPQMIAQNIDITLFVGDAVTNTIFSNTTLSLKGVGTNENKAFLEALKAINPKNKEVLAFLEEGKTKIINYYSTNCDFIIKEAQTLVKQEKYDEAIYQLSLVPDVCQACYFKCLDTLGSIYQKKIDADCRSKLSQAKILWAGESNATNAENVLNILVDISPQSYCFKDVNKLIEEISTKIIADEKTRLELAIKKYNDEISIEKEKIEAYRDIAVEYAKNQPKTVTYNNIFWK